MSRQSKQSKNALIPDEITPDMLNDLLPKAQGLLRAASIYAAAVRKLVEYDTKTAWRKAWPAATMDPITETLYDTADLAQICMDAGLAVETMLAKPLSSRQMVLLQDLRASITRFTTDGGDTVDPETGEITNTDDTNGEETE